MAPSSLRSIYTVQYDSYWPHVAIEQLKRVLYT